MSVDFWIQAEWFYETILIIIGVLIFTLIAGAILVKSIKRNHVKSNRKERNKPFWIMLTIVGVLLIIGVTGHLIYRPYLQEVSIVNPLLRDRQRELFGYEPYPQRDQDYYRNLNYIEPLRESTLYDESTQTQPVEFLGTENTLHYFKNDRDEIYRVSQINVDYVDDLDHAQLIGSQFKLNNKEFEDIGFRNPPYIMFERLEVPSNLNNLEYELDNPTDVRENQYAFPDWIF